MRAVLAAVLVGAAVAFFALGALTSHYRTAPGPWLYSMVRDSKAALQSVREKPDDHKHRADGAKKSVAKVIPSGLLNFDFVIHKLDPTRSQLRGPSVPLGVNYADVLADDKRWLPNPRQGRHDN